MAPVPGMSKAMVLNALREFEGDTLELSLGSPHRNAQITFDGTLWKLSPMITNGARVAEVSKRRIDAGLSFMVEHVVDLQEPGPALIQTSDKVQFMDAIEAIPWVFGGPDLNKIQPREGS